MVGDRSASTLLTGDATRDGDPSKARCGDILALGDCVVPEANRLWSDGGLGELGVVRFGDRGEATARGEDTEIGDCGAVAATRIGEPR